MTSNNPLYFLTHEGRPKTFSGYGIPIIDHEKSPLLGMLMVDRPARCPEDYLRRLSDTFGGVLIGPMVKNGDRGILTEMRIEDPFSLSLLIEDEFYDPVAEGIKNVLLATMKDRYLPKPKLKLHWLRDYRLWVSEFDLDHLEIPEGSGDLQ